MHSRNIKEWKNSLRMYSRAFREAMDPAEKEAAETEAAQVSTAAEYFRGRSLPIQDGTSTITANGSGKTAFAEAQNVGSQFGTALDQDAQNIRRLGNAFEEFDAMMGALNGQGN